MIANLTPRRMGSLLRRSLREAGHDGVVTQLGGGLMFSVTRATDVEAVAATVRAALPEAKVDTSERYVTVSCR